MDLLFATVQFVSCNIVWHVEQSPIIMIWIVESTKPSKQHSSKHKRKKNYKKYAKVT